MESFIEPSYIVVILQAFTHLFSPDIKTCPDLKSDLDFYRMCSISKKNYQITDLKYFISIPRSYHQFHPMNILKYLNLSFITFITSFDQRIDDFSKVIAQSINCFDYCVKDELNRATCFESWLHAINFQDDSGIYQFAYRKRNLWMITQKNCGSNLITYKKIKGFGNFIVFIVSEKISPKIFFYYGKNQNASISSI